MIESHLEKKLNIDKSTWTLTKLGDLAKAVSKRVDNPSESGYAKFVGLQHFVSGDLKIKNWGSTKDLGSSMKAFKSGNILFARRNAYLRRASLVDFDGVCSGDAFVLEENHDKIVSGFLAFIVNSDKLWDYANSNAAGTMSKRVKWRDLANYEFLLPPKEQQGRLAELLWAGDEVVEKCKFLTKETIRNHKALFKNEIYDSTEKLDVFFGNLKSKFPVIKLGELITEIQYGISESLSEVGEVPILRMNNLQKGKLDISDLKYYSPKKQNELKKYILKKGDILFNRTNSFDLVGKVSQFDEEGLFSFASYLIRIKTDNTQLDSRFLNYYLNSELGLSKIRKYRTPGVSQSNINAQNLRKFPVPLPKIEFQSNLMDKIEYFEKSIQNIEERILTTQSLQKSLINQIF